MQTLKIVVLISGSGSNLQAIINAIKENRLDAEISVVICNNADAYGLKRAHSESIPTEIIDHRLFESRELFDQQLIKVIDHYKAELIVMAGFMRILSDGFIKHYKNRMINIHPSLLPKYKGLNTHERVLESGDEEHGLTIHYVTTELDSGPILKQVKIKINKGDTKEVLAARILQLEHIAYPEVIQCIAKQKTI